MFFSQQGKQNVIVTNKNGKHVLAVELPSDVRLKKISDLKLKKNFVEL